MSPSSAAPVLVTGAGGFIGGAVAAYITAVGRQVRAGTRSLASTREDDAPGAEPVLCDLDRPETLAAAAAGTGAIVHAAVGPAGLMLPQMRSLLTAANTAGVSRIVHFSSIAVYGERDGLIDEADGPLGRLDAYGAAKLACEQALAAWVGAAKGRRSAVILRPGIVYGRGSRLWIDELELRIRSGGWGTFRRAGEGRGALVHVDDVAAATLCALDAFSTGTQVVHLVGPEQPSWNRYFTLLADRFGVPLRAIGPVELAARQAVSLPFKAAARLGLPVPATIARAPLPAEMRLFGRCATYASERAATVLGWHPTVGLAEGLDRSFKP